MMKDIFTHAGLLPPTSTFLSFSHTPTLHRLHCVVKQPIATQRKHWKGFYDAVNHQTDAWQCQYVLYVWVVPRFEIENNIGIIILGEEEKDGSELVHGCTINF